MAAGGSKKVIVLALFANGGIAIAKLVAAIFTRSGSMTAEAIHSFADCGNQGLLLLGGSRASKPADANHPLGYGREAYFWGLLVAVLLFTVGGLFSVYEGWHKFDEPQPLAHIGWAIGVLLVSLGLESVSLHAAWVACSKLRGATPLLAWARTTGEVDLLIVVFEDLAAEAGLVLALAAVSLAAVTGDTRYDAAGSLAVGLVLLAVAVFVAVQVKRLIVGFSAGSAFDAAIRAIWEARGFRVLRLISVWSGPGNVMVAMKVGLPATGAERAEEALRLVNETEKAVRAAHPEVGFQFVEPDLED